MGNVIDTERARDNLGFVPGPEPDFRVARSPKSPDERKEILARSIAAEIGHGARVESHTEYGATLVPVRHTNHVLHLILTLVTRSVWAPVWLILTWLHGEKRTVATVDEYGRVQTSGNWLPSISREDRLARA